MSEGGGTVEELVVVGETIRREDPNPGFGEVTFSVLTPSGYVAFDPFNFNQLNQQFVSGPPVETPGTPPVRVDPNIPKDSPQYARALADALSIADQVAEVDAPVRSVGDNETIFMARNNTLTGAQFKALWGNMQYTVTTVDFGAGRGGEVVMTPGGASESQVNVGTIEGYQANAGVFGTNYYILHEVAHTTAPVIDYNQSQFTAYLARMSNAGTPDPTGSLYYNSPEGQSVERFANNTAQLFANLAGVSLWPNPPYGTTFPP